LCKQTFTCPFLPANHVHDVDLVRHVDVAGHDGVGALLEVDVVVVVVVVVAGTIRRGLDFFEKRTKVFLF
jgi:hypothetical protein